MDTAIMVALGLGAFGAILSLINQFWGTGILVRREKVVVVNSEVYPEFLHKGARERTRGGESITLAYPVLSIEVRCELVLTSGEKQLEVKEVELMLDKKACESLRKYFNFPLRNRLYLEPVDNFGEEPLLMPVLLLPKITVRFETKIPLNCTDEFEKEHEKIGSDHYPEFIQSFLNELETNYHICWTRYDGKKLCWRFPQRWWRNLGKRLWG